MSERFDNDETLAGELAEALRTVRPYVDEVAARAKGAFTWRTIDEELLTAVLMFDSAHQFEPSRTRAAESGRVMVFAAEPSRVEIEVSPDRVLGQLLPESAGEVVVEADHGVVATVTVDDLGFFIIEPVPVGVVRFRCTTPTTRLVTDWVRL
jgi:hypothetical protein